MKYSRFISILSVLLVASYGLSEAQIRTWKSPESIFTIDDRTELTKVELSDTATLVSFRRTSPWGNDTLRVHSTTYIIDEQGNRHYALASYGIPMDEYVRWGNRSEWCYTLKFDPLPSSTKSIDVLIGPYSGNAQWYGVHEAGTDLNIPTPKSTVTDDELRAELMKKGTATVRGHVTNGKDYPVWPVWVLRCWDDMNSRTFYDKGKAVLIQENGDFEFTVDLQRPTFASLYLGYKTQLKPILLYLVPGETVTLDVRDVYGQGAYVGYSSNQRLRKLLECYPARLLSDIWPMSTEYKDGTMKLNNYLIDKYDLSPMEIRILQSIGEVRYKYLCLYEIAYRDFNEGQPRTAVAVALMKKQLDEAISKLKTDDISWVFSTFFAEFANDICNDMNPDNGMHCQTVSDMKTFVPMLDKRLHEIFKTSSYPVLLQELSLQQLAPWLQNLYPLNKEDMEDAISYLENHYSDPYVKGRVRGLLENIANKDLVKGTYPVAESENSTGVLERIYAPYKGKFLQIITLRNGENKHILQDMGKLLYQYANSKDVAFVFVSQGDEIADEDCVNQILNFYTYQLFRQGNEFLKNGYVHLSDAEYNELAVAFNCITGDFDYATLDREGKPLKRPFSMSSESAFIFSVNEQLYGYYDYEPTREEIEQRNGIGILDYEWNTLDALNFSLNKGKNIRPDVFVRDYASPLIVSDNDQEYRTYVYLTKENGGQPLEFELTKHLRLPSDGTYRIDMLYSIDGDNLNGTLGGEAFTLNTQECHAALKNMTREQASKIPVLAPVANMPPESHDSVSVIDAETGEVIPGVVVPSSRSLTTAWDTFQSQIDNWGWNYAQFTVKQENGAGTIDCTFCQDSDAVKKLKKKAINWLCIIDLRITKLE